MGVGLGAVVQAEDADDDALEVGGDHDRPGAAAEGPAAGMVVLLRASTPKAALMSATVPESQTLRRASLVGRPPGCAPGRTPSTLAMSSARHHGLAASCRGSGTGARCGSSGPSPPT